MKTLPRCSACPSLLIVTLGILAFCAPKPAQAQSWRGTLGASPSSLTFSPTNVGSARSLSLVLRNFGRRSLTVSKLTVANSAFSVTGLSLPLTITGGHGASLTVVFRPKTPGTSSSQLIFASNARNSALAVSVSGTGAATTSVVVTPNPTSLSFGSVQVGASRALNEVLKNTGTASVTISAATLTGTGFSFTGLTLPLTLTAGQSVTFPVTFAPKTSGAASGSLAISSNAAAVSISLSGTAGAAGSLAASPASLAFGSVNVGSSKTLTGTLTASNASVTVSSASTGSPEFTVGGLTLPLTLASGQSASYSVTFTPQSSGAASVSASFVSNAATSPQETLTGTGVAVPTPSHSVKLSWTASTSSVTGYNVYRGTASGGPYTKLNTSVNASTTYSDAAVTSGKTYYYVVTAVNSSGAESTYSNQVTAIVP